MALLHDDSDRGGERSAAVIDLGSNSWRFVAYRYVPGGAWRRVGQLQEPVRIAKGLATTGRLDADRIAHGLETLEMFARYSRALGVEREDVSVVATSALRDAEDGGEVLARARALTGWEIRTLSAEEEANYGYLAAVNSTTLTAGLALDLGGGSLQLVSVRDRAAQGFASWPLGAVRVTERLLPGDGVTSRKQLRKARAALRRELDGLGGLATGHARMVGMGGAVRNLVGAAMRARDATPAGVQGGVLCVAELRELIDVLAARQPDRRALPGIKSSRADIILAAALVIEAVFDLGEVKALEATRAGLREGVFFSSCLLAGSPPVVADVRSAAVRNLTAQHAVDLRRADHVARLATQLHDSLRDASVIKPAGDERELLWTAAMVHDIGMAVDYDGHPAHARYLLLNSELYGFGPREVALIAQIVRYHRKGTPDLDDLASLAHRGDRALVARCALMLRLAAQLAPGQDDSVREARLVARGDELHLQLRGDDRLARWSLARQTGDEAFGPVFGKRLALG